MNHLTDAEIAALSFRIVELLDGVPIGQALTILTKDAPLLLHDGHTVNVTNPRFLALKVNHG